MIGHETFIDAASRLDATTAITSTAAIILITIGRAVWYFYKKKKEEKLKVLLSKHEAKQESTIEIGGLELMSETYIDIIKTLREEVNRLKIDVEELSKLKEENSKLAENLELCNEAHEKCAKQLRTLQGKVSRLEKKAKKNKRSRLPI